MAAKKGFKVLIAGGGIAGLTLANMLEKLNINYEIVEGYSSMTPEVGASIGLFPNGLRILDQLDLADDMRELIHKPIETALMLKPGGKLLHHYDHVSTQTRARHGYEIVFVDRQLVLGKLYKKLQKKDNIHVNKKVKEVKLKPAGVEVVTTDGSTFQGDILIGADGVHSTVRSEMWRLADSQEPGWIPASEHSQGLLTTHKCIFGISLSKIYEPYTSGTHMGNGFSYLTIGGPDDKVYWFLFVDMKETYHINDLPRFSREDEAALVKEHAGDVLTDQLTFGDLYKTATSSTLTAIPEYCFKKWHYDRIITMGDASHKFNPISGQGGNSAIESCAVLCNNLHALLQTTSSPTTAEIKSIFAATQAKRVPRVETLIRDAHEEQILAAIEKPSVNVVAKLIPHFSFDQIFGSRSDAFEPGERLDMLPIPKRKRAQPFYDERPAYPLAPSALPKLLTVGVLAGFVYLSILSMGLPDWNIPELLSKSTFAGRPLLREITGYPAVDEALSLVLVTFSEGVAGADIFQRIQAAYFLLTITPLVYIMTVEGHRNGNHLMPGVTLPVVFVMVAQVIGFGKMAPVYYLLSVFTSGNTNYTRTLGRPVPSPVAKALLPAVFVGLLVPTVLLLLPRAGDVDAVFTQLAAVLWLPSPIYAAVLTWLLAKVIELSSAKPVTPFHLEVLENKDLAALQRGYAVTGGVLALVHAAMVWYASRTPELLAKLLDAFFGLPAPADVTVAALGGDLYGFFKWDFFLTIASVLVFSLYSVYELRRLGYVTSATAIKAGLAVLAGQVVVGPGATYAGLWAWRENVIASLTEVNSGE